MMPAKSMADSADRFCSASAAFLPPRRRTWWWYIVLPSRFLPPPSPPLSRYNIPYPSLCPLCPLSGISSLPFSHTLPFSLPSLVLPASLCLSLLAVTFGLSRSIYLSISPSPFACFIRLGIVQTDGITISSSFAVYVSGKMDYIRPAIRELAAS